MNTLTLAINSIALLQFTGVINSDFSFIGFALGWNASIIIIGIIFGYIEDYLNNKHDTV